jgi:hypothetical protein
VMRGSALNLPRGVPSREKERSEPYPSPLAPDALVTRICMLAFYEDSLLPFEAVYPCRERRATHLAA